MKLHFLNKHERQQITPFQIHTFYFTSQQSYFWMLTIIQDAERWFHRAKPIMRMKLKSNSLSTLPNYMFCCICLSPRNTHYQIYPAVYTYANIRKISSLNAEYLRHVL